MSDQHDEPLPLFLVTPRGPLAVEEQESVAARRVAGEQDSQLFETLVETTGHRAENIARIVNVVALIPAPPGRFAGEDGRVAVVHPDGA